MNAMIRKAIAQHPRRWISLSLGLLLAYHALLLVALLARFDAQPNYATLYPVWSNWVRILASTPALTDAWGLLLDEPWFEMGYRNPDYYGIAEWSFMLLPSRLVVMALSAMLFATTCCVLHSTQGTPGTDHGRAFRLGSGVGFVVLGIGGATLTWVVCCATPSWIVLLAMFGVSTSLALFLEPLGVVLMLSGLFLQGALLVIQAKPREDMSCEKMPRQSEHAGLNSSLHAPQPLGGSR